MVVALDTTAAEKGCRIKGPAQAVTPGPDQVDTTMLVSGRGSDLMEVGRSIHSRRVSRVCQLPLRTTGTPPAAIRRLRPQVGFHPVSSVATRSSAGRWPAASLDSAASGPDFREFSAVRTV